ncbi:MAG: hypothetical protein HQL32_12920, partial [Planctomycetes bacterium]|nr:hypothetical protein [Planctomycetota bacterium]
MSVSKHTGIATSSPSANLSVSGNVYATGSVTALDAYVTGSVTVNSSMSLDAAISFNDSGAAMDYRVEGDTDSNLLYSDASADFVGIGTSSPTQALHVVGNAAVSGNAVALNLAPTSQLLILDGSVSKKPIDFDSAPDYSFYFNSGNIHFAPNGTSLFHISSGNLFLEGADLRTDKWHNSPSVFIGASVAGNNDFSSSGLRNVGFGYRALHKISTADDTVAIGAEAFSSQSTEGKGVAIGAYCGPEANAEYRTIVGYSISGNNDNVTGSGQTVFGYAAQAKSSGHGANSSAAGSYAAYSDTNTQVVALGAYAAYERQSSSGTSIGFEAG